MIVAVCLVYLYMLIIGREQRKHAARRKGDGFSCQLWFPPPFCTILAILAAPGPMSQETHTCWVRPHEPHANEFFPFSITSLPCPRHSYCSPLSWILICLHPLLPPCSPYPAHPQLRGQASSSQWTRTIYEAMERTQTLESEEPRISSGQDIALSDSQFPRL